MSAVLFLVCVSFFERSLRAPVVAMGSGAYRVVTRHPRTSQDAFDVFMLIGVEVLVVAFSGRGLMAGLIVIFIVLFARFVSVAVPIKIIGLRSQFPPGVVRILTWAGLRGGISVALALSLAPGPEKNIILSSTYMVVLFSILVQGMTIKKVLRKFL